MQERTSIRDVEHLIRPVGLAVIVLLSFLLIHAFFVPDDFGLYGHYRAGALDDSRSREPKYAGRQVCIECHGDVSEARTGGAHDQIGCEACHGALAAHAGEPSEIAPARPDPAALCLRCHGYSSYRPTGFPQVIVDEHAMDEPCDSCHEPHNPGLE